MSAHQQRRQSRQLLRQLRELWQLGKLWQLWQLRQLRQGGVGYHLGALVNFLLLLFIDFVRMHNQHTAQTDCSCWCIRFHGQWHQQRTLLQRGYNCQNARLGQRLADGLRPQRVMKCCICMCVSVCVCVSVYWIMVMCMSPFTYDSPLYGFGSESVCAGC